ncbi:MAG: hypothetical protein DKT66_28560 [Candidatus Melainabacteria bacterium]|nr:MAG: hypothetical protein DKT66_28560 [Candidatus Melainabacteria bacterium]
MRSVAKHSYIKGASGAARAKAHINYIQYRRGEDRENDKPREFFSPDREGIQGREVKQDIDNLDRSKVVAHKLILSPGLQNVDMQQYTRDLLKEVGKEKGLDLDWRAVIHKNTDHDHAHVVVFGKDKNGREVLFDRGDYKNMRDAGDRYLERHHYYERFLQRDMDKQLDKGFERDRGDNVFEALIRDLNPDRKEPEREQKAYQAKPWDKEKAIEHLPEQEKIERDGETYSKYSKLDDLKELAERLNTGELERLPDEQYKKLGQWIWTKERAGDDHFERKARDKWDKKEKRKERDPFEDDREFKKLDKDLKKSFKELEKGGDFGKGYKQWMREQQGRLSPEHRSYTDAMAEQRLKDLMERFPDRKEDFERQLEELKQIDQDLKPEQQKGDKWQEFDALLGENWKSPEKELEQGKERQDQAKTGPSLIDGAADRVADDLAIDHVHDSMSGDKTQEPEREIDDGFDRGLG